MKTIALSLLLSAAPAFASLDWQVDFKCDASKWTNGPTVANGLFTGRIEADCRFKSTTGGTFLQLEKALVQSVVDTADKVHSGPSPITIDKMPGTYLDATTTQEVDGMKATIRADLNFVTDGTIRFVNLSKSKEISATGLAKNLKAINGGFEVRASSTAGGEYSLHIATEMQITKPGAVPAGLFKNKVVQGLEDQMQTRQGELIAQLAKTL